VSAIAAFAGLAPHFLATEAIMAEALASPELKVDGLIRDLGTFHGKMLRPALVLLVADAVGGITVLHHRLGAALEMIHTATLIHDDLIDDADTRRARPTAHVRFGNTTAVLLGDYFYTHAFHLVAAQREADLTERLTATTNVICRGELHQQLAARDVAITEAEYDRIIYGKTACLTELAAEFGAARGTAEQRQAAAAFGLACGMAFQIVDDCLDFSDDPQKVGKSLGTDLACGRMTLPVIRLLEAAGPRRAEYAAMIAQPDGSPVLAEAIRTGGALAAARATAERHVEAALAALAGLPAGPARDRLADLARFIVARDH
jgi:octaprenyl-diphosphate synthase